MMLSVVIPARNEEGSAAATLLSLSVALRASNIPHEIIVVDDDSTDQTTAVVISLQAQLPELKLVRNTGSHGFGWAVRLGLDHVSGEAVTIVMADGSDSPEDVVACYRKLHEGYDCVFGSRFLPGSQVIDYPAHKLALNRMANWFIRALFQLDCNDITNAFKCYRREVIAAMHPLISPHFNLTVEMPLKAIVRGFAYAQIPIRWTNRKHGVSKLKIKEMGSRYLYIVLCLWLERHLARGDYHRPVKTSLPSWPHLAGGSTTPAAPGANPHAG